MKTRTTLHHIDLRDDDDVEEVTVPGKMPPTRADGWVATSCSRRSLAARWARCTSAAPSSRRTRPVAIKHLYPWIAANSSYANTYLREARLAARIHHPNVAQTIDVVTGPAKGELYLVMDYVHGDTLSHLLSRSWRQDGAGPPLPIVVGVMGGLLRGLHAVQEATLAGDFPAQHAQREVSPQDVIVGLDGVTRIFEFGAINLVHGHMRELVAGRGTDVFSAGAMLWEILAGRRLFGDSAELDIFLTSGNNMPPPPSQFNGDVPPELDAVVLRALRKDRGRRFQSAHLFAEAIEGTLRPASTREIGDWVARTSTHLLAARAVRVAGITRTTHDPVPQTPSIQQPWSPPRARRRAARGITATVAVCSALIGAGLMSSSLQMRGGQSANASKRAPETRAVAAAAPTATVAEPGQAAPAPVVRPVIRSVMRPVAAPLAPVQRPLGRAARSAWPVSQSWIARQSKPTSA